MKRLTLGAAALALSLVLTGCVGESDDSAAEPARESEVSEPEDEDPSPMPSEESTEAEAAAVDATKDDLLIMEVPGDCMDLGGKRLIDGELVWKPTGARAYVLSEFEPFGIDADGDGALELIAAFYCDGGGVSWPGQFVLVDAGGALLDSADVVAAFGSDGQTRGQIESWSVAEKHVDAAVHVSAGGTDGGSVVKGTVSAAAGKLVFKQGEPVEASTAPATTDRATVDVASKEASVADDEFKDAKFSSMGYGPLGLTTPGSTLVQKGWGIDTGTEDCPAVEAAPRLTDKGIKFLVEGGMEGHLWEIFAFTDHPKTPSGAHVGMTVEALKSVYGAELKSGADPYDFYVDAEANKALTFQVEGGTVVMMGVHNYSSQHLWDIHGYC